MTGSTVDEVDGVTDDVEDDGVINDDEDAPDEYVGAADEDVRDVKEVCVSSEDISASKEEDPPSEDDVWAAVAEMEG